MSLPEQETNEFVCAAPHVTLHELDGGGVLFDAHGERLYAFNETATFIWRRIEDGVPAALIVEQVSRDFAIPLERAAEFIASAIRCWEELSLLLERAHHAEGRERWPAAVARSGQPSRPPQAPNGRGAMPAHSVPVGPRAAHQAVAGAHYRLFDMPFVVRAGDPLIAAMVERFLWPLATEPTAEPPTVVDIATDSNGMSLSAEGILLEHCEQAPDLLPLIKTCLIELALGRSRGVGAVHAAALAGPHGAVLLPARSGEGKSTLTAALMNAGFRLLGDDTVALTDAVEARKAPFAICLKEGAWTLLSARFPQLAQAPTYRRMDGKTVRYLFPKSREQVGKPEGRYPIRWVVFLRRGADEAVRLVPVSKADALTRLTAEFSPLAGGLSEPQIERLVQWIRAVDCFELRFTDVDEGVEQITRLCGVPHVTEFADRH
jgi:hypothetical protein